MDQAVSMAENSP